MDNCRQKPTEALVSVYIPTRNREHLLVRALDSVLGQTYTNIEVLVCDDASTDGTRDLVGDYAARHENIRYLRNDEQQGACLTRNRAIFAARGHYVTGLDDDDEFLPGRIEQFIRHFDARWSFLAALAVSHTPAGQPHRIFRPTRVVSHDDMLYFNRIGNQIFILTERMRSIGGFNPRYPAWQDYELWTRLIAHFGPALRLDLHSQYIHQAHDSERISDSDAARRALRLYLADFGDEMSPQHRAAQRFFFKTNYPQLGEASYLDFAKMTTSPILRELAGAFLFQKHPEAIHRLSRLRSALRRITRIDRLDYRTTTSP